MYKQLLQSIIREYSLLNTILLTLLLQNIKCYVKNGVVVVKLSSHTQ